MTDREYIAQTAALLSARAVTLGLDQRYVQAAYNAVELHRIATRLHRIDERNCDDPGPKGHGLGCEKCEGHGTVQVSPPGSAGAGMQTCKACAGKGHILGKAEARNEARATAIAAVYGMRVYFQGDCRGCPVYLIPNDAGDPNEDHANYNSRGVAVCHLGR